MNTIIKTLGTLASVALAMTACSSSSSSATLTCGPGTTAESGQCVVTIDGGTLDGTADDGADAAIGSRCPSARGPKMAELPIPSGGTYCIDTTEVTVAQYLAFTKSNDIPPAPAYCGQLGIEHTPWTMCTGGGGTVRTSWKDNEPISCVNWCHAYQFCAWAGKRLCGAIGGGPTATRTMGTTTNDPKGQWLNACTEFGKHDYCYGDFEQDGVCVGWKGAGSTPAPVASAVDCHPPDSPFAQVFDLLGNVEEWEDSCDAYVAPHDGCWTRSSSYTDTPGFQRPCSGAEWTTRDTILPQIGFRCCAD